ncbi:MAG: methyl-accepting chemotaxis protein [Ramlibacter sp.]
MRFISRMKVLHRFAVIGAIALTATAVPVAMSVVRVYGTMQVAQREADGIAPVRATLLAMQRVQQHRGLSAAVLGGNAAAQADRDAARQEATRALEALVALAPRVRDATTLALLRKVAADWPAVYQRTGAPGATAADSFAAHSTLVASLLTLTDLLTDDFGLSLDPDLDTYQLIQASMVSMPVLSEELARVRGLGATLLASPVRRESDLRAVVASLARADDALQAMHRTYGKAAAANAVLKQQLDSVEAEAVAQARRAAALARDRLLEPAQASLSPTEFYAQLSLAVDAQLTLANAAMDTLDSLLTSRAADQRRSLAGLLALVVVLLGLGAWVSLVAARSILRQIGGEPFELVTVARAISQGDLTAHVPVRSGDTRSIVAAMAGMKTNLAGVVRRVRGNADSVVTASTQIAHGNQDLSQRTEEQANALQQTAASMEELGSTVRLTSDNAQRANALAQEATRIAGQGGQVVAQVVQRMGGINDSAKQIADIIGVIDGIAFQTNILALNAAVEAARAGEQGRGFAVVAAEVRTLAGRSAEAAREIRGLITNSVEQVGQGSTLVAQAGETMHEIEASIQRVSALVAEISNASVEQASGVAQVGQAVTQMDQVTQQNAALVEESAAAAESLRQQAHELMEAVAAFRLPAEAPGMAPAQPVPQARPAPVTNVMPIKRAAAARAAAPDPANAWPVAGDKTGTDDWRAF